MVSTRRSGKIKNTEEGKDDAHTKKVKEASETLSSTKKKGRTRKQRRSGDLKSKNTGVGLSISLSPSNPNKKIVFGDDDKLPDEDVVEDETPGTLRAPVPTGPGGEDNDDEVEEVKGSAAREKMLEQLKSEEKGALRTKKKRKRKDRKVESDSDNDEDLDEDFFAQLESVKVQEAKETEKQKRKPKGKHTAFVFQEHDESRRGDPSAPKQVDHNIQVVVLPDQDAVVDSAITAIPTNALSEDALTFSRNRLVDGSDRGGGKKKRKGATTPDATWKRSRKMNLLITAKSGFNRRIGRGKPAANFVKKKR